MNVIVENVEILPVITLLFGYCCVLYRY